MDRQGTGADIGPGTKGQGQPVDVYYLHTLRENRVPGQEMEKGHGQTGARDMARTRGQGTGTASGCLLFADPYVKIKLLDRKGKRIGKKKKTSGN